jgi:hypothetical protein
MDQVSDQPLLSGIGQDEPPSESYFEFNIGYHGKTAGGKLVSDGEESRADGVPYSLRDDLHESTSLSKESVARLSEHVNSVGENLEQLSSELKDYLHTTMGKSVANFSAVEEDVNGLETIVLAAIDGNRRLLEKHALFQKRLVVARVLAQKISVLKAVVSSIDTALSAPTG